MNARQQEWSARSAPTSLRTWDAVLGRQVRDLWRFAAGESGLQNDTPVCFETGELIHWAVDLYSRKDASGHAISPTEHLNIEGARLARFLTSSGWSGPAFVLNASASAHAEVCAAIATSYERDVASVRVSHPVNIDDAETPTWAVRLKVQHARVL